MKIKNFIVYVSVSLLLVGVLGAQTAGTSFQRNSEFMTGAYFQKWSARGSQSVSEWVLPVSYILPLNRQLTFHLMNAPTHANSNFTDKSLSGFIDTRFNASYVMMEEKLMLSGGVSLPTGNSRLEGDQSILSAFLADDALGFRVPTLGQGLDFKVNLAYATQVGGFVFGGGIGYLRKGEFQPLKNSEVQYKPGDEMTATFGLDKSFEMGENPAKILLDVTYTLYGKDKLDDSEIFKSGNRLRVELRSLFKLSSVDLLLYLRERTKGKNEKGLRSLTKESLNSNGNQLELGTITFLPMGETFRLKGLFDTKIYSKNAYKQNGAFILGVGSGFQFRLSDHFTIDTQFKYLTGSLKNTTAGGDISEKITGLEAGAIFRFTL